MPYIPDPELYARMAEPYSTAEEAQKAMCDFCAEVRVLREKHRIAEVVMIVGVNCGDELLAMTQALGNARRAPELAIALMKQTAETMAAQHDQEAAEWRKAAGAWWVDRTPCGRQTAAEEPGTSKPEPTLCKPVT